MIVPTMTPGEMYAQIMSDYNLLRNYFVTCLDKIRRPAMKALKFPFCQTYQIHSKKTNIDYNLKMWTFTHSQWKNPYYAFYLSYTHEGGTTYLSFALNNGEPQLDIFTHHFITRYLERIQNKQGEGHKGFIDDFLLYNSNSTIYDEEEELEKLMRTSEKYIKRDDVHYHGERTPEGLMICETCDSEPNITVHTTIIANEQLRKEQIKESVFGENNARLNTLSERFPTLKESLKKKMYEILDEGDNKGLPVDDTGMNVARWLDQVEKELYK